MFSKLAKKMVGDYLRNSLHFMGEIFSLSFLSWNRSECLSTPQRFALHV